MPNFPAVTVIIPLYNAEKYFSATLESLLAQTFTDFDVVVADDCSTDSSCAIVERYAAKFGGRLKLTRTEKNSGSGAIPRNIGLTLAHGEYVFNMDNDDLLTPTALEEMYALAKNFDADVVACERYYVARADLGEIFICDGRKDVVDKPTFASDDLTERVRELIDEKFFVTPWSKLVRRDVLIDNEIAFPSVTIADDDIWTCEILFSAGKILRVPNAVYIWRQTKSSVMRRERSPQEMLRFWLIGASRHRNRKAHVARNLRGNKKFFRRFTRRARRFDIVAPCRFDNAAERFRRQSPAHCRTRKTIK